MALHCTARVQHSLDLSVTYLALCGGQQVSDSNDGYHVTVLFCVALESEILIAKAFCTDSLKMEIRQKQ